MSTASTWSGTQRVVVLGMDGLDPVLLARFMEEGILPHFAALSREGGFRPLATANPSQSPVAWATLATGVNPGRHGVFDFLHRNPRTYGIDLSITRITGAGPQFGHPLAAEAFWETAADAGVPSTVLRWPLTFPPRGKARVLAGLGVPDVRGRMGAYAVYTTHAAFPADDVKGHVVVLDGARSAWTTEIRGPFTTSASQYATVPLEIRLRDGGGAPSVDLVCGGREGPPITLAEGQWSPLVTLRFVFKAGGLFGMGGTRHEVAAAMQFLLVRAAEPLLLYVSPPAVDAAAPVFPIASPADLAPRIAAEIGAFNTLGMAEDINAVRDGVLSPAAFLASCRERIDEQERMLLWALGAQASGLVAFVFFTPDRIQHFFWAGIDREHHFNARAPGGDPLLDHTAAFHALGEAPIRECYARMDAVLGKVMARLDARDTLLVVSDHGFTTFRREFHVNRWLVDAGYMALDDREGKNLFASVRWAATRAYSLGFAGIYINRAGREGRGCVAPGDAHAVAQEIRAGLLALNDPDTGQRPVARAWLGHELFTGPHAQDGPDIVLGLARGYRVSSDTALGAAPAALFSDTTDPWTGTHLCDPALVPGILLANRRMVRDDASVADIAPAVLDALGVALPGRYEGKPFLAGS